MQITRVPVRIAALLVAGTAFGTDFCEGPMDAGSLPPDARRVFGDPPLDGINGMLSGPPAKGAEDFEDMFLIRVDEPALFEVCIPPNGAIAVQLWLFDEDGLGLLATQGDEMGGALLPSVSNDGSGAVLSVPGNYFLAISGQPARVPRSDIGDIFMFTAQGEVSGPDGPGGMLPIFEWAGDGDFGGYESEVVGVGVFCSADFNGDGVIAEDLLYVLAHYEKFGQILEVLAQWGPCMQ